MKRGNWRLALAALLLSCAVTAMPQSQAQAPNPVVADWPGATMEPIVEEDERQAFRPEGAPGTAAAVFAKALTPAPLVANTRVIGAYNRGCLAGAVAMPSQSPDWQLMRPSRNRAWGHPVLIKTATDIALSARKAGWPGLLFGDFSQVRGGPMPYGHASHQIGLDADIWLTPMPRNKLSTDGLEQFAPPSMVNMNTQGTEPALFGALQISLIKIAAEHPNVARVFVNARIKNSLCQSFAPSDRAWLNTVRPAPGHDAHLHIRLHCPEDEPLCQAQKPPEKGDGCDELAGWLKPPPKVTAPPKPAPRSRQLKLSALPTQCRTLLAAP